MSVLTSTSKGFQEPSKASSDVVYCLQHNILFTLGWGESALFASPVGVRSANLAKGKNGNEVSCLRILY